MIGIVSRSLLDFQDILSKSRRGALRGQQVTVGAQPAEPNRTRQPSVRAEADRPYFEQVESGVGDKATRFAARKQMQRQTGDALMHRHDAVAALGTGSQAQAVAQQPGSAGSVPGVEPAIVNVQDEATSRTEEAEGVRDHAAA